MSAPITALVHLVDDDDAVRDALARLLASVGLRVQGWADAQQFLRGFDRDAIGVVVLDVRMPGLGGLALLEAVQTAVRTHSRSRERDDAARAARERFARLSEREHEVLALVIEGLTAKQIARRLDLSPRTVETHRAHLSEKLEVESLAQLVRRYAALVDEQGAA